MYCKNNIIINDFKDIPIDIYGSFIECDVMNNEGTLKYYNIKFKEKEIKKERIKNRFEILDI